MARRRTKTKSGVLLVLSILMVLLLSVGVWLLFFGFNRFSLELELLGQERLILEYGEDYVEPGCRVLLRGTKFWKDGLELNGAVEISGNVDESRLGKYTLDYRGEYFGLECGASRIVRVVDTVCPVITLVPDGEDLKPAPVYREAGFTAYDNHDGDITDRVVRREEEGRVLYSVVDSSGNPVSVERPIPIYDENPPELTLVGGQRVVVPLGLPFADPGYRAYDKMDGDLTEQVSVTIDHPFSRYVPDSYELTYQVADKEGRNTLVSRTLVTQPSPRPLILYPREKTIYLTFDDGPGPYTEKLLDILKRHDVKATFFVVDNGYPDLLRRMVREGHSVGVHTRSHRYAEIYSDAEGYFADLFAMQQVIQQATGEETWLLRFPGGGSNTISRKNQGLMTYLTQAVQDCGFAYFDWNVDSGDSGEAKTSAAVFQNVVDGIVQNDYPVVLQHDIQSHSVDAVERIILWGKEQGYHFRPLQIDSPQVHHPVLN